MGLGRLTNPPSITVLAEPNNQWHQACKCTLHDKQCLPNAAATAAAQQQLLPPQRQHHTQIEQSPTALERQRHHPLVARAYCTASGSTSASVVALVCVTLARQPTTHLWLDRTAPPAAGPLPAACAAPRPRRVAPLPAPGQPLPRGTSPPGILPPGTHRPLGRPSGPAPAACPTPAARHKPGCSTQHAASRPPWR